MTTENPSLDLNPGQELQNFLKELIPLDSSDESLDSSSCFITRLDNMIMADGEFSQLVYDSCINYLVRRLITTADYLKRKYSSDDFPAERFVEELRKFILDWTRIQGSDCEKLLSLLQLCLEAGSKKVKNSLKKRIRKRDEVNNELRCYICGMSLSYGELDNNEVQKQQSIDSENQIEIEHIFPRAMGGATEEFNLKVSCKFCNKTKQDYIEASDFHYEKICLAQDKDDENFAKEFKREYKIAIWSKSQYACTSCGKPASEIGRLNFGRNNLNDSWHFLNIAAYCDEHRPE